MVGRRRVGKTTLLNETYQGESALYLFISRKSEALLCEAFADQTRTEMMWNSLAVCANIME